MTRFEKNLSSLPYAERLNHPRLFSLLKMRVWGMWFWCFRSWEFMLFFLLDGHCGYASNSLHCEYSVLISVFQTAVPVWHRILVTGNPALVNLFKIYLISLGRTYFPALISPRFLNFWWRVIALICFFSIKLLHCLICIDRFHYLAVGQFRCINILTY